MTRGCCFRWSAQASEQNPNQHHFHTIKNLCSDSKNSCNIILKILRLIFFGRAFFERALRPARVNVVKCVAASNTVRMFLKSPSHTATQIARILSRQQIYESSMTACADDVTRRMLRRSKRAAIGVASTRVRCLACEKTSRIPASLWIRPGQENDARANLFESRDAYH
jgi:hypothetical protein